MEHYNCETFFRNSDTLKGTLERFLPDVDLQYPDERLDDQYGVTVAVSVARREDLGEGYTQRVIIFPGAVFGGPFEWEGVAQYAISHYFNHGTWPNAISTFLSVTHQTGTAFHCGRDSYPDQIAKVLATLKQGFHNVEWNQIDSMSINTAGVSIIRKGVKPVGVVSR